MSDRIVLSKKTVTMLAVIMLVGSVIGFFVISRSRTTLKTYRQAEFLLDTLVEITVASVDEQQAHEAIEAAYAEMRRIEALLSRYVPGSQISQVNDAAGKAAFVPVTHETLAILQRSQQYSRMTHGFFDMSVGPVIDLWGIGTDHEHVPEPSALQQTVSLVDYRNVEIDEEHGVRLRLSGMALDLGGIAKGYSIDRGIDVLRRHHMPHALLNAGGDMRTLGPKPDGTAWRIGIQHPRKPGEMLGILELQDRAVATSGDYERYFMYQGMRYHHLFVPATGMPARACQSVTILAETAEQADVFATAVFIMGPERGLTFLEEQPNVDGMIVRSDGEFVVSSGFSFQLMN